MALRFSFSALRVLNIDRPAQHDGRLGLVLAHTVFATALAVGLSSACGTSKPDAEQLGTSAAPIADGTAVAAEDAEARFTVSLGTCTGTLLSKRAILTAGHCVEDAAAGRARRSPRIGVDAGRCVGVETDACGPTDFRVVRHPSQDLALLVSERDLRGVEEADLPLVLIDGPIKKFFGAGFGVGSVLTEHGSDPVANGSRLLRGSFDVEQIASAVVIARGSSSTGRVCKGDSGGPAFVRLHDGRSGVFGALLVSENGSQDDECTPNNGRQVWLNVGRELAFIEGALGSCARSVVDGYSVADCSRTARSAPMASAASNERRADGAWEDYLKQNAVKRWEKVKADGTVDASLVVRGGSEQLVGVGTPAGQYMAVVDREETVGEYGNFYGTNTAPASADGAWGNADGRMA